MAKVALLIGVSTNLAVKEGYNTQLVKAPMGDLKLEYHKIVNRSQIELRLSADEARETKNEVLAPTASANKIYKNMKKH